MRRILSFRDFDWALLLMVLALCGISLIEVHSTTMHTRFASFESKQMLFIAGGVAGMFILAKIDYHRLLDWAPWAYGIFLVSLVLVKLIGHKVMGARRWIGIGPVQFQPSEWVKLVLVLVIARYFANLGARNLTWSDIFKAFAMVGIPMILVLIQPDLGTTLTYAPILIAGLFLGGISFKQAAILITCFLVLAGGVWSSGKLLKPYQKARLTSFINPANDPRGSGYQINQSLIAVGSGGIWGKGTEKGTQTQGVFPADSVHRLHLCGLQRGTRVCGRGFCATAILPSIDAFDSKRSNSRRPVWFPHYHGNRGCVDLSDSGQRRHGHRADARHRNPSTFNELWRIFGAVHVPGAGGGNECPHAPVRQLTHLDPFGFRCRPESSPLSRRWGN